MSDTENNNPNEAAIEKAVTAMTLAEKLSQDTPALFLAKYSEQLAATQAELPDARAVDKLLDSMPDELSDKVSGIMQRFTAKRKGLYTADDRPEMTELRLYHGTGNDQNRPDNMVPGQYYLTTKTTVGKEFVGTVIALYEGRTMWGDKGAGESTRMPVCQSMDRVVGSNYGKCADCPNRPWARGQATNCSDDVIAYMLSRDLEDIVLVRFAKTSSPAGTRLKKYVTKSSALWSKWYSITADAVVNPKDKSQKYYVMKASPIEGDDEQVYTPEALHNFCDMMCTVLNAKVLLPNIAHIYKMAKECLENPITPAPAGGGSVGLMNDNESGGSSTPDYGSIGEDAPDTETNV